jgi:hypothetical protein
MVNTHHFLLMVDAVINLLLGILLLLMPFGLDHIIGLPVSGNYFYTTILGAVLFGIGIALLQERYGDRRDIRGLGLHGAIAINFCGASMLLFWLIFSDLHIPLRGLIVLWTVVVIVFATAIVELLMKSSK